MSTHVTTQPAACSFRLEHDAGAIALPQGEITIGRSEECFLKLDDPEVSRVHLLIRVGETLVACDAESTNGTLINGQPLRGERQLEHGDVIALGDRSFTVRLRQMDGGYWDDLTPVRGLTTGGDSEPTGALEAQCQRCGAHVTATGTACPSCGHAPRRGGSVGAATMRRVSQIPTSQRRRHERLPLQITGVYTSRAMSVAGSTRNLSRTGVFLCADKPDEVGARCQLMLHPADGRPQTFDGFVRHVIHGAGHARGMGIEFGDLDDAQIRWLARQVLQARRRAE